MAKRGLGYYGVDSSDGNELTTGLSEAEAHQVAQRHADRLGESVYVYEVGSDDEAEEIKPSRGSRSRMRRNMDGLERAQALRRLDREPGLTGRWDYRGVEIVVSKENSRVWIAKVSLAGMKPLRASSFEMLMAEATELIDENSHRPNTTLRLEKKWKVGDRGAEYEFDVKLHDERMRGMDISDDELEMETEAAIDIFAKELRKTYPWVGRVGRRGRSGGWLFVEDKLGQATKDELSDINDRVDEAHEDFIKALVETFGYTENGIDPKLRKAYDFFREHAGGIVGEGAKGALALARAEKIAHDEGWEADWEEDHDEYELGDNETERPFEVLSCVLRDQEGVLLGAVGGVGMSGNMREDRDRRRVIEAELALEAATGFDRAVREAFELNAERRKGLL